MSFLHSRATKTVNSIQNMHSFETLSPIKLRNGDSCSFSFPNADLFRLFEYSRMMLAQAPNATAEREREKDMNQPCLLLVVVCRAKENGNNRKMKVQLTQ